MKTYKNAWCCVDTSGKEERFLFVTINNTRHKSIRSLLALFPSNIKFNKWDIWRKNGTKCVKVNVSIERVE